MGWPWSWWWTLQIYGGLDQTSPLLSTLCHTQDTAQVLTSTGNNMVVRFFSDVSNSGRGFNASYTSIAGGYRSRNRNLKTPYFLSFPLLCRSGRSLQSIRSHIDILHNLPLLCGQLPTRLTAQIPTLHHTATSFTRSFAYDPISIVAASVTTHPKVSMHNSYTTVHIDSGRFHWIFKSHRHATNIVAYQPSSAPHLSSVFPQAFRSILKNQLLNNSSSYPTYSNLMSWTEAALAESPSS